MSDKSVLRALNPCELPDVHRVSVSSSGDTVIIHHHVMIAPDDMVIVETRMPRRQALELADAIVRDAGKDDSFIDRALIDGLPN